MFIHSVYFWLKPDITPAQQAAFVDGLATLGAVETVRAMYTGTPAATDRPVIDRSYSYALILVFADQQGHDSYQVSATHLAFVEKLSSLWTQVQIYDCVG